MTGPVSVGLIGAGHQSRMQLEALAAVYRVDSAAVFSPTAANRERFAREMSAKLGISVEAANSAADAARGRPVVVAATSSRSAEPVLRGEWLEGCRLLCAVGSTRPESIEVDERCFRDAALVVVDSPRAAEEAGDLQQALRKGAVGEGKQVALSRIAAGAVSVPERERVVFKSVGTALQDLALAAHYYKLLGPSAARVDGLASLKQPVSAAR